MNKPNLRLKKNSLRVLNGNESIQVQGGVAADTQNQDTQRIPGLTTDCPTEDWRCQYSAGCTDTCSVNCPTNTCPTQGLQRLCYSDDCGGL